VFVIDGKDQDQQRNNDRMARSEAETPGVKEATHDKNAETTKCETTKYDDLTPFRSFGYRELEESRVETLHHRSPKVVKCETPKYRIVDLTRFRSFGYRELEESRVPKLRNVKCQNTGLLI
jgi:hypothetical protein